MAPKALLFEIGTANANDDLDFASRSFKLEFMALAHELPWLDSNPVVPDF